MKLDSGLRDHPVAIIAVVLGIVCVLFVFGFLTYRIGQRWTHAYIHRQTQAPE